MLGFAEARHGLYCFHSVPQLYPGFTKVQKQSLLPSRDSQGFCWPFPKLTRGPADFQRAPGTLLGFAEAHKGLSSSPECPRAFAGLCQRLQGAPLLSRVPWGFCCVFPKLTRGSAAFQRASGLLSGFAEAHKGPYCLPDFPRAFSRLCQSPQGFFVPSRLLDVNE